MKNFDDNTTDGESDHRVLPSSPSPRLFFASVFNFVLKEGFTQQFFI